MKIVSLAASDALRFLEEHLGNDQSVVLRVTGSSMRPLFRHRKTLVEIRPIRREPRRNDILLCRIGDRLVLHRLIGTGDRLTLRGDARFSNETCGRSDVLGIVSKYGADEPAKPVNRPLQRLHVLLYRTALRFRRAIRKGRDSNHA